MAIIDYAIQDGNTPTSDWIYSFLRGPYSELNIYNESNIVDGDDNTYAYIEAYSRSVSLQTTFAYGTAYIEIDLNKTRYLEDVVFIIEEYQSGDAGVETRSKFYLRYLQPSGPYYDLYIDPSNGASAKTTHTFNSITTNKLRVEGYVYVKIPAAFGIKTGRAEVRIYSIKANGYYFPETQFKFYNGSNIITLGRETIVDNTTPLRYYDGTSVRALALLPPDHPYATPFRIYNGTSIKAIAMAVT